MESKKYTMDFAGRPLTLEFGRYCEQANGSVWVHLGDTVVMVNATMAPAPREGVDFFPLAVDVEEKQYSVGKIPGGFIKREGRPSEKATLTCRLIDRPLRPLFEKGMRNDVQVVVTILSVEQDVPPEIPAMIGSSVALAVSDIPWNGPTGAVLVGRVNGQFVICPDEAQRAESDLSLYVAGTEDAIMMVEAGAKELSEETMLDAILFGHEEIKKLVAFQKQIVAEIGKEKQVVPLITTGDDIKAAVREFAYDKCVWTFATFDRQERQQREAQTKEETLAALAERFEGRESEIEDALYYLNKEVMRAKILNEGIRPDGRKVTEIRPIWCDVGVLPRTHGSAIFTRGQTQALTVTTLGTVSEGQTLDGLSSEDFKRYIHHYNMPPYATGEAGRLKSPGRREIGHGALAERALLPVIPSEEEFPYALRLVSEILSSNGSSSMASVCGSTLSLAGINRAILQQALRQALEGRLHILKIMLDTLGQPRSELSPYAPKIIRFTINPEKIREVIGPGGKMINKIIAETGVKIDIEDDGSVFISTPDQQAADKARHIIEGIAKDIEVGDVYTGKVVRIMNFGAFVELAPGKDGMIHISKLDNKRVEKVEDVVNIGDELEVKVNEIDAQGRINLIRNDIEYTSGTDFSRHDGNRRPPRRTSNHD